MLGGTKLSLHPILSHEILQIFDQKTAPDLLGLQTRVHVRGNAAEAEVEMPTTSVSIFQALAIHLANSTEFANRL